MNAALLERPEISEVSIGIETGLHEQAEAILQQIGMSFSEAVNLFMRQVVLRGGFPVELNLPPNKPLCLEDMTDNELIAAFEEGMNDIRAGKCHTSEEVRKIMEEDL